MKAIQTYEITENKALTKDVYRMVLKGETNWIHHPGQFINIDIPSAYLKRPISICDWDEESLTIIYKVVGKGTKWMSEQHDGTIDALVNLGNGFDTSKADEVVLVGGGVGVPPLYGCAKTLLKEGKKVSVVLGFNKQNEIFCKDEFEALGVDTYICTLDGSVGTKGFVTDGLKEHGLLDTFYMACGPLPMLKALHKTSHASGLLSFEERMGCGFGACMGCSMETANGPKRVCKEGPVFESEEILWKD